MAINAAHWTVTRSNGNVRYIGPDHGVGGETYATVIEFHRWLQDLADDATSSGDDELDITDELPSARSTDNIINLLGNYNIDDNASEHLYDGSIIQASGADIYDGIVNFGNPAVQIQIHQNGAVLVDDWWNEGGAGLNPDAANGISHRFMIPVRVAGTDVDGRRIIGTARRFNFTYQEFGINGTSRGNNVLALADASDLNNATVEGTVSGWTGIALTTEGYVGLDVDASGADEFYYAEWNTNQPTRSINDFYERLKWLTRDGSASTLYGLNGELFRGITHEIDVDTPTGTFSAFEAVSWTGGTGQMLAINSTTAATKMWIQLLTGIAPTDGLTITGGGSSATVDVNITVLARTISIPFVGASTGSAIIGSYGLGIETTDLTAADKVFDLTNTLITPPNNVQFTVGGLISGEDRVIVAPWDGASTDVEGNPAITVAQLSLATLLDADNETEVVVAEAIPSDTPATGYIRVVDDAGFTRRLHYSSWSVSTFTLGGGDYPDGNEDFLANEAAINNDVWIAYVDEIASGVTESFTATYNADRDLVVIVRDGDSTPIKQFITAAIFGSAPTTITAIRTTDA